MLSTVPQYVIGHSFNDQGIPLYISHYGMLLVQPCQSNHVTKRRETVLSIFGNHFGSHFHLNMHMCVQSLSAGKDGVTCVRMLLHVEAQKAKRIISAVQNHCLAVQNTELVIDIFKMCILSPLTREGRSGFF